MGHHDSSSVLPFLLRFFPKEFSDRPALLIDIGANIGDTSATFINYFTDVDCIRYQERMPPQGMHEDCKANIPVRILAYEPVPENFELLQERAKHALWTSVGWKAYQVALTSPTALEALPVQPGGSREIKFYITLKNGASVAGDQQGGLGPTNGVTSFINVEGWTLDGHLASIREVGEILLLKIDTEGFDAQTLAGAQATLEAKRVVFLVFEYNDKWHAASDKIKPVSQWLFGLGYECYWITRDRLVPLSGRLWHDSYEFFAWSNVFCHRVGDEKAHRLVNFYNMEETNICAA